MCICGIFRRICGHARLKHVFGHAATLTTNRDEFKAFAYGLAGEFQDLVYGQRQDAEHEMRHDFGRAAHTNVAAAELVL